MLRTEPGFGALVLLIFLLGVVIRCYIPFTDGAPFFHDGGFHLVLAEELVANNFVPPHFTSYNFLNIPYVYPPLSTYLTAGLHFVFDLPIESVLRYAPALISCLVLWASFRFLGQLKFSRLEYSVAILIGATLPYTFIQLIKGGGISRGLGALFAFLAMREMCLLLERSSAERKSSIRRPEMFPLGIYFGLACLSHPEWALAVLLFMLSAVLVGRNKQLSIHFLGASAVAAVINLPWGVMVLTRHGVLPIFNALLGSGEPLGFASILALKPFPGAYHPVLITLAYVGIVAAVLRKLYLFPLVFLVGAGLQTRGHNFTSAIPFAVLVAYGFSMLIGTARNYLSSNQNDGRASVSAGRLERVSFALLIALSIAEASQVFSPATAFSMRLRPGELRALEWIRENTSTSARFVVLNGSPWWSDYLNEVFPAFARRQSLTTCQGTEWLPDQAFSKCKSLVNRLASFNTVQDAEALSAALSDLRPDFMLIAKSKVNQDVVAAILREMTESVFENEEIKIIKFADGTLSA